MYALEGTQTPTAAHVLKHGYVQSNETDVEFIGIIAAFPDVGSTFQPVVEYIIEANIAFKARQFAQVKFEPSLALSVQVNEDGVYSKVPVPSEAEDSECGTAKHERAQTCSLDSSTHSDIM